MNFLNIMKLSETFTRVNHLIARVSHYDKMSLHLVYGSGKVLAIFEQDTFVRARETSG